MTRRKFTYKDQDISVHIEQRFFPSKVLITGAHQPWPIDQFPLTHFATEDEAAEYGRKAAEWRIDHPQTSRKKRSTK
jgi:hypothetical protein